MRTCKVCLTEKPLTAEFFSPVKSKGKLYWRWQCRTCELVRNREFYANNLETQRARVKKYGLEVRHGLGDGGYQRLLDGQGGRCAICNTDNPGNRVKYFAVDHDHTCCPGKYSCGKCVRGLLCVRCNRGLGEFQDDTSRLEKAIEYVRLVHKRSPQE